MTHDDLKRRAEDWRLKGRERVTADYLVSDLLAALEKAEAEALKFRKLFGEAPEVHEDLTMVDLNRSSVDVLVDWVRRTRAECEARGNLFDTGFRCISEGGTIWEFDPEEIERLVAERDEARAQLATARAAALEEAAQVSNANRCGSDCDDTNCAALTCQVSRRIAEKIRALAPTPPGVVVLTREEAEQVREALARCENALRPMGPAGTAEAIDFLDSVLERKR